VTSAEEVFAILGRLPTLETERLVLRRLRPEDVGDIFAYASDPEVARSTLSEPHRSIEESEMVLGHWLERYARGWIAPWGLEHRGAGTIVGTCGFLDKYCDPPRSMEIGYAMSSRYWGRGLMTEAVRAVVDFGFRALGVERIQARCLVENVASARVLEKAGMRYVETYDGVYGDKFALYAIVRREWETARCGAR
jgi:ribosomal-protein-alanine N-acetyltransferase